MYTLGGGTTLKEGQKFVKILFYKIFIICIGYILKHSIWTFKICINFNQYWKVMSMLCVANNLVYSFLECIIL